MGLLTPENLPAVLTGIGAIIAAIGGFTLYRVQKEPPKPGTPDAVTVALVDNTKAMQALAGQFQANNQLFEAVLTHVKAMGRDAAEAHHEAAEANKHLASIRDAVNRRTP